MAKSYQVTKTINGKEYTAQFSGLRAWLRLVDDSHIGSSNVVSSDKIAENTLKRGLVDPKIDIDDFDSYNEMQEVVNFVQSVMQGNFRDSADAKGAKAESK